MRVIEEEFMVFYWESVKKRNCLEDQDVDGRVFDIHCKIIGYEVVIYFNLDPVRTMCSVLVTR
jgi:hypothetical protein